MKHKILCTVLVIGVLVTSLLVACPAAEKEPIKIGFMTDLTGFLNINGIPGRQAAILAIEEANYEVAGRPVELVIEDDASDVAIATERARKLVETDKVSVMIGPFAVHTFMAVADFLEPYEIPALTIGNPMSNEAQAAANLVWSPFGTWPGAGYVTGIYATTELGYKTATFLGTDYAAGHEILKGFKVGFEEGGGSIIQEQWIPLGTADVAPYISALEEADVLTPWLAGVTATVGLQQFKEFNVPMPIVMPQTSFPAHPQQIVEIGDNGLGIITSDIYVWTIDNPASHAFVEAYQDRWDTLPTNYAYPAYTSVKIVLDVLSRTGGDTSSAKLTQALDETDFEGIMGRISFKDTPRVATYTQFVHKVVKVGGEYRTEILKYYTVKSERVGDTLKQTIIESHNP